MPSGDGGGGMPGGFPGLNLTTAATSLLKLGSSTVLVQYIYV